MTNDNGGKLRVSDVRLALDGTAVTSGTPVAVSPGTHTASETPVTGYTATFSDGCDATGSISVGLGESKTCTITNDDQQASLTLKKTVVNDDGGTKTVSDFPLYINGKAAVSGTAYTLDAGSYTATESGLSGYTATAWGTDCNADGTITLAPGDTKTCTITNNDVAPTVTLTKTVTNDNGGTKSASDFTLTLDGVAVTQGNATTVKANTAIAIDEASVSGYRFVRITGDRGCPTALGGTVTLSEGQNLSCTVENDDIPARLTVIKNVDNAGVATTSSDAFTMTIAGVAVPDGDSFPGSSSGTTRTVIPGTYSVTESGPAGYTASESATCSGSIALGEEKTCTVTNTRDTATLTVKKNVDYDGNGDLTGNMDRVDATDWTWDIAGGEQDIVTGQTKTLGTGTYTVSEDQKSDYELVGWSCSNEQSGSTNSATVSLGKGDHVTCTFTNRVKTGSISGYKWNDVDGNGRFDMESEVGKESGIANWTVFIDTDKDSILDDGETSATTSADGSYTMNGLLPGSYRVCEVIKSGWKQTYPAIEGSASCHDVTVSAGVTTTNVNFGNRFVPPELTIEKYNNRWPTAVGPGGDVLYTIVIKAEKNTAYDVKVKDLLPQGFKYRKGSWTAVSSLHGALSIAEPTYASPGTWTLNGTGEGMYEGVEAGEQITLTYRADVATDELAGTYKDIAWASARETPDTDATRILASSVATTQSGDPGNIGGSFVGTKVAVDRETQDSVTLNVVREEKKTETGSVLGASTELPATGADARWLMLAAGLLGTGAAAAAAAFALRRKYA